MKREIHFRRPARWDVNGIYTGTLCEFYSRKLMLYFVQQDDFGGQIISPARLRNIPRKSILIIPDYIMFFIYDTLYNIIILHMKILQNLV